MAQMLPMVQIVPEMNYAYDPVSGLISSSLGSGIVLLSMDDVAELTVDRDGSGYGARGANGVVIIRTMKGSDR